MIAVDRSSHSKRSFLDGPWLIPIAGGMILHSMMRTRMYLAGDFLTVRGSKAKLSPCVCSRLGFAERVHSNQTTRVKPGGITALSVFSRPAESRRAIPPSCIVMSCRDAAFAVHGQTMPDVRCGAAGVDTEQMVQEGEQGGLGDACMSSFQLSHGKAASQRFHSIGEQKFGPLFLPCPTSRWNRQIRRHEHFSL